jgi:Tol biopolymer transport system component
MANHGERLLDSVAQAVSDGDAVDWARVDSAAPDPETRDLLHQLKVVANIANLHRKTAQEDELAALAQELDPDAARTSPHQTSAALHEPLPADTWSHLSLREVIGRGAYGTVYRAWDPRLDREVALKLIPESIGRGYADAVIHEARLLAKVNHPNVVTIYGAARAEGMVGLWMELIEGQTLEQILQERGRFSAREATLVGLDVCEALAAVHGAGLLHRDVKAHNVMRDRNGRIVLMDFGAGREQGLPGETAIADLAGTPLYMAPELFSGGEASPRSDVYGVGVLLYRLVTGKVPITARSLEEVRRVHASGEVRRLRDERSDLPGPFVQIVERALSPDPKKRFESAGAFEMALTGLLTATSEGAHIPGQIRPLPLTETVRRRWLLAMSVVTLALAALGAIAWLALANRQQQSAAGAAGSQARFIIYPPLQTEFESFAISPDGRFLAFTAAGQLWLRALDSLEATRFADTQGAHDPFWSPDGRHLGYFRGTSLWIVSREGADARPLCQARNPSGGSWGPDNTILFAADLGRAIYRVSVQTGERQALRLQGPHGFDLQWPFFLPSGRGFIFSARRTAEGPRSILAAGFNTSDPDTWLLASESNVQVSAGHLLYVRDGTLFAQPFDERRLRLSGEAARVADRVPANLYIRTDYANFSAATGGSATLAYLGGARLTDRELVRVSRAGVRERILGPGEYRDLALSHSGQLLAYEERDPETGTRDIWAVDLTRMQPWRITSHPGDDTGPVWSTDDRTIYYVSNRDGRFQFQRRSADGTGAESLLLDDSAKIVPFSIVGSLFAFSRMDQQRDSDLWMTFLDPAQPSASAVAQRKPLRTTEYRESEPQISPDGKWFAYSSTDTGHRQVYIESIASPGPRWQVSGRNGREPQWRADGRELFFHGHERRLEAASIDLSVTPPVIGAPQPLFELKFRGWDTRYHFVAAPDGQSFILNSPVDGSHPVPVTVVMNWPSR